MDQSTLSPTPLFSLGEICITPGAEAILTPLEIECFLHRHQHGDYGEMDPEGAHLNNAGLRNCIMVMSVYRASDGTEFWIKTHGTRSHTQIMLPGE